MASIPVAGKFYFSTNIESIVFFVILARGSSGISVVLGPPNYGVDQDFVPVQSKACRTMLFSPDGSYFVYVIGPM